ncbi:uncharacterized protein [Macrobrachium rosenbergii]|uniref:uncharacterized protein isoform X2 n=1 Tax=Macrobrachium rosenbergii TaxID=79674 RepID=UPI0034D55D71
MDSFICGTCGRTFHALNDFAEHKETHKSQFASLSCSTAQDKSIAADVTQITAPIFSPVAPLVSLPCTEENSPSKTLPTQTKGFQSVSVISPSKKLNSITYSTAKRHSSIGGSFPIVQPRVVNGQGMLKHSGFRGKNNGQEFYSLSSTLSKFTSGDVDCNINNEDPLVSLKVGCKPTSSAYPLPLIPRSQESQKGLSHQMLGEGSLALDSGNQEGKDQTSIPVSLECKPHPLQAGKNCIHIYESNNEDIPFGQLILEDNLMDVLCIEISSDGKIVESMLSDICSVRAVPKTLTNGMCVDAKAQVKEEEKISTRGLKDYDKTNQEVKKSSKSSCQPHNSVENDQLLTAKSCMELGSNFVVEESVGNEESENVERNVISSRHNVIDHQVESNKVTEEKIVVKFRARDCPKDILLEDSKEGRYANLAEGEGPGLTMRTDCEPGLVSDEGMDLMNLYGGEVTDMTYASAPGLYTLILNADNSFTLIAGGCQGSANGQSSRIYVCHHCKKFASSQLEILNHISHTHPEDLVDVNRCIAEFSSLSNSESDVNASDTGQIILSSDTSTGGKLNSEELDDKCILEMDENHPNQDLLSKYEPKRVTRKKVGRPRKEDRLAVDEDCSFRSGEARSFTKDGDNIICMNCQKSFPKHRQFDKHKCHIWKENLHTAEVNDKLSLPGVEGGTGEYCIFDENLENFSSSFLEYDLGEEWKASKRYKPKVKIKSRDVERIKRGRPPKVDVMDKKPMPFPNSEDNGSEANKGIINPMSSNCTEYKALGPHQSSGAYVASQSSGVSSGANPPILNSIPTLPIFSNAQQQERLHKWIAQIDLSFVDTIIDKLCHNDRNVGSPSGEMYMCRECKVLFRSLMACRRHCAKHMARKAFTCPDCDFATTNVGALYSHYRNHTQNLYACNKCDFRARIKAHFRDHLETHNPNRYICRLCQRPYSTSNSLRSHIYLYHSNEEGTKYLWCLRKKNQDCNSKNVFFQCPVCSKLFGERSSANRHLASHAPIVPEVFIRCEICEAEMPNPGTLKKHMLKHKVVYICCICHKPQATASCLRNHQKIQCPAPQPESFRQSLLLSFTSSETLPSLLSNKRIGPLLQEKTNHNSEDKSLTNCKVSGSLLLQMQEVGYKQICELLRDNKDDKLKGRESEQTVSDVMKIVIDTRYGEENEQFVSWEQQQPRVGNIEHPHQDEELDQTHYQEIEMESQSSTYGAQSVIPHRDNMADVSPMGLLNQDPASGESDQRVVVISNNGEEQTVVVEDGPMMMMEEERFVIISDESVCKQPISFSKFFEDNG